MSRPRPFDTELFRAIIEGAIAEFNNAHPEEAVPKGNWQSISKRASRNLMHQFRLRFGNPTDQIVEEARARREHLQEDARSRSA